jgi:hypothetical protein
VAFTKEQEYKVEVLHDRVLQVRRNDIVKEDGVVVGSKFHRHVVVPGDDVSGEPAVVQSCAAALWTPEVVTAYAEANPAEEEAS